MGRKCDFWRPPGRVYILRHGCGHCRCADCCKGDAINAAPGAPKHPSRNQCTSHWPHADKRETEEYGCRARSVQTTAAIWNYKKVHWRISIDTCASDSVGCPESLHAAQKRIYMGIAERYCVNWKWPSHHCKAHRCARSQDHCDHQVPAGRQRHARCGCGCKQWQDRCPRL